MRHSDQDRVIALAGVFQAAWCAQRIATGGLADSGAMAASIHSIFQIDAADVPQVFDGSHRVAWGLRQLLVQIRGDGGRDLDLTRYVIGLMQLERKLASDALRQTRIAAGISRVRELLAHLSILHPSILGQLADLYGENLSSLRPRILVKGKQIYLTNGDNVNRIRALLLAGVRAARLWRQVGGTRWQLLFGRTRLLGSAAGLLEEIAARTSNPVQPQAD